MADTENTRRSAELELQAGLIVELMRRVRSLESCVYWVVADMATIDPADGSTKP